MMRLIDADVAKARLHVMLEHYEYRKDDFGIGKASGLVDAMEAVDAVLEHRGKWYTVKDYSEGNRVALECSECGGHVASEYGYCPHCGARMEVDDD